MSTALAADIGGGTLGAPKFDRTIARRAIALGVVALGIGLAGVALVPSRHRTKAVVPVLNYSALFHDPRGLPKGLSLMPSPAVSRWKLAADVRAVRLGARLADLEIASRARDRATHASYYDRNPIANWTVDVSSAHIYDFAGDLATGFAAVPEGRVAAAWYRIIQARGRDLATVDWTDMGHAREWALDFHPELLVLGEWLELARAAALRHDDAFFDRAESRAMVDAAIDRSQLPPDATMSLIQVRTLTSGPAVGDFHALEHALTAALQSLTD